MTVDRDSMLLAFITTLLLSAFPCALAVRLYRNLTK